MSMRPIRSVNCTNWPWHNADYAQAMAWYRKSAAAGDSSAICNVAYLYLNGLG